MRKAKEAAALEYRRKVLGQIEGDYLLDYAVFAGVLREYVTRTLEQQFKADPNEIHRRLFLLSVYTQEYFAYEDLAALLDALMTHRRNPAIPIVDRLISYRAGEVSLQQVMNRFGISSAKKLHEELGLAELVPAGWATRFPKLDLVRTLKIAANFFFTDCLKNQKDEGRRAFNKLKHGLLVVPNARVYLGSSINAPAAIIETPSKHPDADTHPISIFALKSTDEDLKQRLDSVHFIQTNLRLIAALLSVVKYPQVAMTRKPGDPLGVFESQYLRDGISFMEQVTAKTKDPW